MVAAVNSLARWRIGHHLFFILIQGLVLALRRFEFALEVGSTQDAASRLESATSLLWASAIAMRFAGDFDPDEYNYDVRPTMAPPQVPDGFSGLLSQDHHVMIEILKRLRPVFAAPPLGLERSRDRFVAALDSAYRCHIFVCRRFAGGETPSLRTAKGNARPAVEVLEKFHRSRLETVELTRRTAAGCPFHRERVSAEGGEPC
jgi:hypothetical protein